jgi:hypothetical protein
MKDIELCAFKVVGGEGVKAFSRWFENRPVRY